MKKLIAICLILLTQLHCSSVFAVIMPGDRPSNEAVSYAQMYKQMINSPFKDEQEKGLNELFEKVLTTEKLSDLTLYYKTLGNVFIEDPDNEFLTMNMATTLVGMQYTEVFYTYASSYSNKNLIKIIKWVNDRVSFYREIKVFNKVTEYFQKQTVWGLVLMKASDDHIRFDQSSLGKYELDMIIQLGIEYLNFDNGLSAHQIKEHKKFVVDSLITLALHWNNEYASSKIIQELLQLYNDDDVATALAISMRTRLRPLLSFIGAYQLKDVTFTIATSLSAIDNEIRTSTLYANVSDFSSPLGFLEKHLKRMPWKRRFSSLVKSTGMFYVLKELSKLHNLKTTVDISDSALEDLNYVGGIAAKVMANPVVQKIQIPKKSCAERFKNILSWN